MGIPDFYNLTGPTTGVKGVTSTAFTLTPLTTVTDTVTFTSNPSGTFSPTSLSWSSSNLPNTFTFTPNSAADYLLTFTSIQHDTVTQSPFAYLATPPAVFTSTGLCGGFGQWIIGGCAIADGVSCAAGPVVQISTIEQAWASMVLNATSIQPTSIFRPQAATSYPQIIVTVDEDPREALLAGGSAPYANSTCTASVYSTKLADCVTVSRELINGLHGTFRVLVGQIFVQSVLCTDKTDKSTYFGTGADTWLFVTNVEFTIKYVPL